MEYARSATESVAFLTIHRLNLALFFCGNTSVQLPLTISAVALICHVCLLFLRSVSFHQIPDNTASIAVTSALAWAATLSTGRCKSFAGSGAA